MADNQDIRTRVSLKRVGIFILAVVLLIFLMGDNPLSRAVDQLLGGIGSLLGLAKGSTSWFAGKDERVYRFGALAMVLIAVVGAIKLLRKRYT